MTTIKDIAREANCSLATVSKAINGKRDISEKTRRRILKIVEEHNFVPNSFGRGLKMHRTENVGVIFCRELQPLSGNPFYSRVLEGIEGEIAINNYNLILHLIPEDYKDDIPKMVRERQVDGLILVGVLKQEFINSIVSKNIPIILVDPKILTENVNQVLIDNEHGAFIATQYLIRLGHRRIGFISGDIERLSFKQRYDGYKKSLKYSNVPFNSELVSTGGLEQGYEHVKKLLDLPIKPTAIFAANDINAIYGYKAVLDLNLIIPDNISIIGFDDIDLSKISSPPLTTIRVYKEELGSIAVRTLLKIINDKIEKATTTIVPVKLIERESVRAVVY